MFTFLNDLNLNSEICENLRDKPESIQDTKIAIQRIEHELKTTDSALKEAKLLAFSGGLQRRLLHLVEAETYLIKAINIMKNQQQILSQTAYEIRLAHVYHWRNKFNIANQLFEELLLRCKLDKTLKVHYLDFVLQHYGKCLFDQNQLKLAEQMFKKTLKIRLEKGIPELIQSTQYALEMTRKKLCQVEATQQS